MTSFQLIALLMIGVWFIAVGVRYRRPTVILIIGLFVLGIYTLMAYTMGEVSKAELGLGKPSSWLLTVLYALGGLVAALAYSPLADRLASRLYPKPPTLDVFGSIQNSWLNLTIGIIIAWLLGGVLEELIARGIVLMSLSGWLSNYVGTPLATGIAILAAALGAGAMHLYQGQRGMTIIAQISLIFGVVFVISGYNLWAVMICHGLYDTIAFIRFAQKKSKYSQNINTEVQ